MRLLKLLLAGFIGLMVFILLLSTLFPSNPSVRRSILISGQPVDTIMKCLHDLRSWPSWHPVFSSAGGATDLQVSADKLSCTIRGKPLEISRVEANNRSVEVVISSPGENPINCHLSCDVITGFREVRVEWLAIHHLSWYPWHKFYAIFLDQLAGPGYEAALAGLRDYCITGRIH